MTPAGPTPGTVRALLGSYDWTGRSGRAPFAIAFGLVLLLGLVNPQGAFIKAYPVAVFSTTAVFLFVWFGQTRRRLRDVGWRGGWMWFGLVPVIGFVLYVALLFKRGVEHTGPVEPSWTRITGFAAVTCLCGILVARGLLFEPYWIPSGSMKPNILPGDYVVSWSSRTTPERGDIVVFRHPVQDADFIKRVIGLPGDRIEMAEGVLILNGDVVPQTADGLFIEPFRRSGPAGHLPRCANMPVGVNETCEKERWQEQLPSGRSYAVLNIDAQAHDVIAAQDVPDGHLFLLGDNRDNSTDSRMAHVIGGLGFVPVENVKGKVSRVLFSLSGDPARIFKVIQ